MIADMTWINSAGTFLDALSDPRAAEQQKGVERALGGMSRGFVPFYQATSQVIQAYNDIFQIPAKQVNDSWQAFYQYVPIARNSLNDKINALGEPVIKDIDLMISEEKPDPVWKFLTDNQGWVAPLNKKTVFVFDQKLRQDRPLTDDEFYNLSKRRGAIIKDAIGKLIKGRTLVMRAGKPISVSKDELTKKELNDALSSIEEAATKKAKGEIFRDVYSKKSNRELQKKINESNSQKWGLQD